MNKKQGVSNNWKLTKYYKARKNRSSKRVLHLIIFICFFLPLVSESCGPLPVSLHTGVGIGLGDSGIPPEPLVFVIPLLALTGFVLCFRTLQKKFRAGTRTKIDIYCAAALSLMFLFFTIKGFTVEHILKVGGGGNRAYTSSGPGGDPITGMLHAAGNAASESTTVGKTFWFYAAFGLSIAAFILSLQSNSLSRWEDEMEQGEISPTGPPDADKAHETTPQDP